LKGLPHLSRKRKGGLSTSHNKKKRRKIKSGGEDQVKEEHAWGIPVTKKEKKRGKKEIPSITKKNGPEEKDPNSAPRKKKG